MNEEGQKIETLCFYSELVEMNLCPAGGGIVSPVWPYVGVKKEAQMFPKVAQIVETAVLI